MTEIETKLQAEAATNTTVIKNLIVRLEDTMISENIPDIKKRLTQLMAVNGDIFREYEVRHKSYKEMITTIKELNIAVQNVARLRGNKHNGFYNILWKLKFFLNNLRTKFGENYLNP